MSQAIGIYLLPDVTTLQAAQLPELPSEATRVLLTGLPNASDARTRALLISQQTHGWSLPEAVCAIRLFVLGRVTSDMRNDSPHWESYWKSYLGETLATDLQVAGAYYVRCLKQANAETQQEGWQ